MDRLYKQRIKEMEVWLIKLLSAPFTRFSDANEYSIPESPGIYLIMEGDKILYSGSAQNLRLRLWQEHYLGEQPRMGGSQFRGILSQVFPHLKDNKEITQHIAKQCSFSFIKIDPVEKRELKFVEDFCNSILRPDFIKYNAKGRFWGTIQRTKRPIMYSCDDCGRKFLSGRRRSGLKLCAECAEKRRREGRGPVQSKRGK